jgi:hypothetical protein
MSGLFKTALLIFSVRIITIKGLKKAMLMHTVETVRLTLKLIVLAAIFDILAKNRNRASIFVE